MVKNQLVIDVNETEAANIQRVFEKIEYDPSGNDCYINALRRLAYSELPARLLARIQEFQGASLSRTPHLVLNHVPIDNNVTGSPSFQETGRTYKDGFLTENVLVAIASILGEPYSIAHEGVELVNNLTPHRAHARDYTGLGSEVELDFHIENAAQHYAEEGSVSPAFLLLLGIRQDSRRAGPLTHLADARAALRLLDEADIETLFSRSFIIRVPHRWRHATSKPQDNTGLCPVLLGSRKTPQVTVAFYPDMVLPINASARAALDRFHLAIREVSVGIDVCPGRLVIINNKFTLHSRDAFDATFDSGGKAYRWLQRVFVAESLWNFRSYPRLGARVFKPVFESNVGNPASARTGLEVAPART